MTGLVSTILLQIKNKTILKHFVKQRIQIFKELKLFFDGFKLNIFNMNKNCTYGHDFIGTGTVKTDMSI